MDVQTRHMLLGISLTILGMVGYQRFFGAHLWVDVLLLSVATIIALSVLWVQWRTDVYEKPKSLKPSRRANRAATNRDGHVVKVSGLKPQYLIQAGARFYIDSPRDLSDLQQRDIVTGDTWNLKPRQLKKITTYPLEGVRLQEQYSDQQWVYRNGKLHAADGQLPAYIVPNGSLSQLHKEARPSEG